jgi:flagellar protein FliS
MEPQRRLIAAASNFGDISMYMAHSRFGTAQARYRNTQLSAVEGSSPHRLVAILFEEALKTLDTMAAATRRRDWGQIGTQQSRVLSILHGLESSLDMEGGGEIAINLAAVYREARRLTMAGGKACDGEVVMQARTMLAEIASAWDAIG